MILKKCTKDIFSLSINKCREIINCEKYNLLFLLHVVNYKKVMKELFLICKALLCLIAKQRVKFNPFSVKHKSQYLLLNAKITKQKTETNCHFSVLECHLHNEQQKIEFCKLIRKAIFLVNGFVTLTTKQNNYKMTQNAYIESSARIKAYTSPSITKQLLIIKQRTELAKWVR